MVSLMRFIVLGFQVRSGIDGYNSHRGEKLLTDWTKLMLMTKQRDSNSNFKHGLLNDKIFSLPPHKVFFERLITTSVS